MKKILSSLFVFSIFSSPYFAVAQVSAPTMPVIQKAVTDLSAGITTMSATSVSSVYINNTQISDQNDRDFTLSFDIVNNTGDVIPQVKYVLHLVRIISPTTSVIVDEMVYDDSFSIDKNSKINKTIKYSILPNLSAGTYNFFLEIGNTSGLTIAGVHFNNVKISSNTTKVVEIVPSSCTISIVNEEREKGPLFADMSDTIIEKCQIESFIETDTVFFPKFNLRFNNMFGDFSSYTGGSQDAITIKKGINNIVLTLPKGKIPQDYYTTFYLETADGKVKTNSDSYTYFLKGLTGSIESVVFDKVIYKSGDVANLKVYSLIYDLGSASQNSAGILKASIIDGSGVSCSATSTNPVSLKMSAGIISLQITKDCVNPTAHLVLSGKDEKNNEIVLDTKDFKVITPESYLPGSFTLSLLYKILLGILAVVVLVTIFTKLIRRRSVINIVLLLIISSTVALFGFTKQSSAITCWPNPSDASIGGYVFCESGQDNVGIYDMSGSSVFNSFNWTGRTVSYSGYTGGFIIWPKGNYNNNLFIITDGSGKYKWNELFQAGNGVFQTQESFSISPNPIAFGGRSTISWSSLGASYCDVFKDGSMWRQNAGKNGAIFSEPINRTTTYTLACGFCYASNGCPNATYQSITVTPTAPPLITSSAINNMVDSGASTTLTWTSENENFCSITANGTPFVTGSAPTPAINQLGSAGAGNGQLNQPRDAIVDSSGNIYVIDRGNNRIEKFDSYGNYISEFYPTPRASSIRGIAIDSQNNIYITESTTDTIQKFIPSGNTYVFSSLFGKTNGLFVAVSDNNTGSIVTSPNGTSWKQRTSPTGVLIDVVYGNGLFVAVSNNNTGRVVTSPDGITWTQRSSPAGSLTGITYANGLFVAVSDNNTGSIVTSPNGITWTQRSSPVGSLYDVTYGNGLFVAVSNNNTGRVVTSPDGITWTQRSSPVGTLNNITYGNGLFVAVSFNNTGTIVTSPDGITWTQRSSPVGTLAGVTYGNGLFVATSFNNTGRVVTSPDGITWTQRTSPIGTLLGITYGNGSFVAVSNNNTGYIVTSPDGITWTQRSSPAGSLTDITFGQAEVPFEFDDPKGIAIDASGNIYVVDSNNDRVVKFNSSGLYQSQFVPQPGDYNFPYGNNADEPYDLTNMAISPSNDIYIADVGNNRVQKFNSSGVFQSELNNNSAPSDITFDLSGNVYVSELSNNNIQKYNSNGNSIGRYNITGNNAGLAFNPNDILSGDQVLYSIDSNNNRVLKYSTSITQLPFKPADSSNQQLSGAKFSSVLTTDTNFLLRCDDITGGFATSSVTVKIKSSITSDISSIPTEVLKNTSAIVNWSSTGATSCALRKNGTPFGGSSAVSGSISSGRLKIPTNFGVICTNGMATSSDITTVGIYNLKVVPSEVEWSCDEGTASASMTKNGAVWGPGSSLTADGGGFFTGVISSPDIIETDTFTLTCVAGDGTETTESSGSGSEFGSGGSACNLSQDVNTTDNPDGNIIYVNRPTRLSAATSTSVTWTGTNITSPLNGNPAYKIFTTIGPKTITASKGGSTVCSTTTTVKLSPGTNQEI